MRKLLLTAIMVVMSLGLFADDPFNPTPDENFGYLDGVYMIMPPTKSVFNTASISGNYITLTNTNTKATHTFHWSVLRKSDKLYCIVDTSIYSLVIEGSKITLTPQFGEDSSNQIIYLWRKK